MKCPECKTNMKVERSNTSHNSKTGQDYNRTIYVCGVDDTWVTTEVPKK